MQKFQLGGRLAVSKFCRKQAPEYRGFQIAEVKVSMHLKHQVVFWIWRFLASCYIVVQFLQPFPGEALNATCQIMRYTRDTEIRIGAAEAPKDKDWRFGGKITPSKLWLKSCPKDKAFRLPRFQHVPKVSVSNLLISFDIFCVKSKKYSVQFGQAAWKRFTFHWMIEAKAKAQML